MERTAAHLAAFELLEAVQGEEHAVAAAAIPVAEAEALEWPEVQFVLAAARTVYAVARPVEGVDAGALVDELLERAPEPAAQAIALGLRGLVAAGSGDTATLLSSTSRAVALLDDRSLPPRERCLAYVINAAALNTLRLWELVDELYTAALVDSRAAREAGQSAAVAMNRILMLLEHGLALLEYGDSSAASGLLREAAARVPAALAEDLRPLWHADALALRDLVHLLLDEPLELPLEQHLEALRSGHDIEVLPLLEAAAALSAWRRTGEIVDFGGATSSSSGASSFPFWVRAQVHGDQHPAVLAQRAHADVIGRLLWESRAAVLSAARAQLATERRQAEHDRLQRAVHTDPLTGLHNRRRFDDWLQRPLSGATALLLLDLDAFKTVNDRFGHDVGDEVLRRIGLLLRAVVRPGDVAVRQGGDEFAVVLRDPELDGDATLSRAHDIERAIRLEPWEDVALGLSVGVSIGAALSVLASPQVVGPALYRAADTALYRAKREGLPPVLADVTISGAPDAESR